MKKSGAAIIMIINIALILFIFHGSHNEPKLLLTAIFPAFLIYGAFRVLRNKKSIFDLK